MTQLVAPLHGGFEELEARIARANDGIVPHGLDRRKLSQLAKGTARNLSMDGLDALNRYLTKERGFGLESVFKSPNLIETAAARGRLTFIIGAKHRDKSTTVSLWDFRCMERMLRGIYRTMPTTQVDVQDVPLPLAPSLVGASGGQSAIRQIDDWEGLLDAPQAPSLICLGSQRVCQTTEVLLSRMFNLAPRTPGVGRAAGAPFAFVWSNGRSQEGNSSFSITPNDFGDAEWRVEAADWKTWGVRLARPAGGSPPVQTHKVHRSGTRWTSYGVIAAQRRPQGQVWLVLAGLSGPETFAGAQVIGSVVRTLPAAREDKPSGVLWALYEALVEERPSQSIGDNRTLLDQRLLLQEYWPS